MPTAWLIPEGSVSDSVLAYQASGDTFELVWYDRRGGASESGWGRQNFGKARISPDGQSVAADIVDVRTGMADLWVFNAARGGPIRFTTDFDDEIEPVWSPDGRRVMFATPRTGAPDLVAKSWGESGSDEVLAQSEKPLSPEDWSKDGRWIAYTETTAQTAEDLWLLSTAGDRKSRPIATTRFEGWGARFSPDSRWIAFVSNESGKSEVHVTSVGKKLRISTGGGSTPLWSNDGKELFYLSADGRFVMTVRVEPGATFKAGNPARLFSIGPAPTSRHRLQRMAFDVAPDGQRFLIGVAIGEPASSRIMVVLNWRAAIRQ